MELFDRLIRLGWLLLAIAVLVLWCTHPHQRWFEIQLETTSDWVSRWH
jgi:hypothetical protein